jgi:hypothetical protein
MQRAHLPLDRMDSSCSSSSCTGIEKANLTLLIPTIEDAEKRMLGSELDGQYVFLQLDGTTRLGEAINVVGTWCTLNFQLRKRLLDFTTIEKHVNNIELATHITDITVHQRGVPVTHVVGLGRDSVAVNGAACRRLLVTMTSAVDILCICHTLCHVGEHFAMPTINMFMTPWLELVGGRNPHAGAKLLWKEVVAPATVPGFSHVRWYSKAEIIYVIAEAGTRRLRDFLLALDQRDFGDVTTKKMLDIYNNHGDKLRLELAAMLDMRILVKITYEMEGDQFEILLVYLRIATLRAIGRSIQAKADDVLHNVDAVLRRLMELKKGVAVEKYFQGHGIAVGKLDKIESVQSTLYPGQDRDAWLVKYPDGFEEHFEE